MRSAIILPPRELFSPTATGAVGVLVRLLARDSNAVVYGMPTPAPFTDAAFQPIKPLWRLGNTAARYAAGLVKALRRTPPDTIEVHNRPDLALHLAKCFPQTPVMLFLHNDPQGMRGARTPAERTHLLANLALVAPVSGYLRARLLEGVAPSAAVDMFPNFIDLTIMPPPTPEPTLLFAGRIVADKGADSFVAACALALPQLPGWRAEMIGADRFGATSPMTPFLAALQPKAAAAGITMHGWQPHNEVLAAMARAAIMVVPSRWPEPFGLTALEAMACGSALLCAPRGGLIDVMGDAAVSINPDDPADIAEKIIALANNPTHRQALSHAGLARAASFSAHAARDRLNALRQSARARWSQRHPTPI